MSKDEEDLAARARRARAIREAARRLETEPDPPPTAPESDRDAIARQMRKLDRKSD